MKAGVYKYQSEATKEVIDYSNELMVVKDQLETSRMKVHKWLRDSNIVELIAKRDEMSAEIEKCLDVDVNVCRHTATMPPIIFYSKWFCIHLPMHHSIFNIWSCGGHRHFYKVNITVNRLSVERGLMNQLMLH